MLELCLNFKWLLTSSVIKYLEDMWRNKSEATSNLQNVEKVASSSTVGSSFPSSSSLSLCHLTCGFADIQTNHPHFARFSKSWLGFLDFNRKIVPFSGLSNPKCVIHPHPEKIAEEGFERDDACGDGELVGGG